MYINLQPHNKRSVPVVSNFGKLPDINLYFPQNLMNIITVTSSLRINYSRRNKVQHIYLQAAAQGVRLCI